VSQYNGSLVAMGQTPPEGLVMANKRFAPRICAIWHGMSSYAIWKQSLDNCVNSLEESFGWK
jgi:hypothetical protein